MNVFICLTPLHFYIAYVEAWNLYKEKREYSHIWVKAPYKYDIRTEYLYIKVHFVNNGTIPKKILNFLIYTYFTEFCKFGEILKKCDTLYIFNERDPITKAALKKVGREVKVVAMEEGIGTWISSEIAYHERINEIQVGFVEGYKRNHPKFDGIVRGIKYSDLFGAANVKEFLKYIGYDMTNICNTTCQVLFLGQPLEPKNKYQEVIEQICKCVPSNINLYIKPHPREYNDFYDKFVETYHNIYKFDANANKIPIECLVRLYNVKCVVTVVSSAAVYLNYINPDIPVILLGDIYGGYFDISLETYMSAIKKNLNSNRLFFPSSNAEFKLILEKIIN